MQSTEVVNGLECLGGAVGASQGSLPRGETPGIVIRGCNFQFLRRKPYAEYRGR